MAEHTTVTDPTLIRQALDLSDRKSHTATARQFGVAVSTLTAWRRRRDRAAACGGVWPADVDVTTWQASKARRDHVRVTRLRWLLRRAALDGPMLIDSTGTRRRLHALAAIGWRYSDIAPHLEVNTSRVGHLAGGTSPTVHRDTAAAVAHVYERLSMTTGPSTRNRMLAAGRGWSPPLAWDEEAIDDPKARPRVGSKRGAKAIDQVALERAMAGDCVYLTPTERAEAVRQLTARGLSAAEIAGRLHITGRSVVRHRTAAA